MIELELRAVPEGAHDYERVAGLVVEDDGTYRLDDPQGVMPLDVSVLAPQPRGGGLERIEFGQNPERWARHASSILRTGYLVPVIVRDTSA